MDLDWHVGIVRLIIEEWCTKANRDKHLSVGKSGMKSIGQDGLPL
jgi:hypothetical protein